MVWVFFTTSVNPIIDTLKHPDTWQPHFEIIIDKTVQTTGQVFRLKRENTRERVIQPKWVKHHTYVKADKLGKYSCPTMFYIIHFIHLYSWCLDTIGNRLFCSCCLRFQLDANFFSFHNPVPPHQTQDASSICCIYLSRKFVGQRVSWVWGGNILQNKTQLHNI